MSYPGQVTDPEKIIPLGKVTPALFFGVAFDLLLFGILTTQVYVYHISFPNDRMLLKIAVVWVYLAGVAQTGLALVDFGISGLKTFNDSFDIMQIDDSGFGYKIDLFPDHLWLSITALTAAVAIVIQSLYAYRIYLISKKCWLATMIICMSLGQFGSGILGAICYSGEEATFSVSNGIGRSFEGGSGQFVHLCDIGFRWIWGALNVICDLTITICMVTFLVGHRKRSTRHQTRSHITKIIQIVVETGMTTTLLMILYTVLFCSGSSNFSRLTPTYHPLPGLMMSKVYSNSMLALLNNRATIGKGRNAVESFEFIEISARGLEGDIQLGTPRGQISAEASR